jgi:hypothetical protein
MPEYREFLDICADYDDVRLDTTMAFTAFIDETMPFPVSELPSSELSTPKAGVDAR